MARKQKPTAADLCDAAEAMAPPRSQAEWRAVSTAMRAARRALGGRAWSRTISLRCGSDRRRLDLWGERPIAPYNGPSRLTYLGMIAFYRRRYVEGSTAGRVADARDFAAAARRDGPVPVP